MRIVICGEDEVAFRLVEALMADHEVTLVCPEDTPHESRIARMDAQRVAGLMTSPPTLRKAGVEQADVFVGCSPSDERNLVACVSAERLGAKRSVCFLLRPDLQLPGEDVRALAESLGIDQIVRPGQQLAEEILRIVLVPGALDVQQFAGGRVQLLRYALEAGAPLTAGALKDVGLPPGVVLVMARRGGEVFVPKGGTQFAPDDQLTAMGTPAGIHRLLSEFLRPAGQRAPRRAATVVGGGTVGLAIAVGLEEAGWRVKMIEADRARCQELARSLRSGLVLHGDGTDLDLLQAEGIADAPVLVAVTSNDEKNLLVSLLAKSLGVDRIVTRADLLSNERLFEKVGIDVVRSSRGAAVRSVLRTVGASRSELLAELEHGDAEVIELTLPADLKPVPLARMKAGLLGIIGAIVRGGDVLVPSGRDAVQGGDHLLVFCMRTQEAAVRDFFLTQVAALAEAP